MKPSGKLMDASSETLSWGAIRARRAQYVFVTVFTWASASNGAAEVELEGTAARWGHERIRP